MSSRKVRVCGVRWCARAATWMPTLWRDSLAPAKYGSARTRGATGATESTLNGNGIRPCAVLFVALLLSSLGFSGPLDVANVNVSFVVNQTFTPAFGVVSDPTYATNQVQAAVSDPYQYSGLAWASYGALGASSSFLDTHVPTPSHGLLSIARFVDQLYLTVPGSLSTTYRWTPTIRLQGIANWTENMPTPVNAPFAVGVATSQGVKTASSSGYVSTSSPDVYPGNGSSLDLTFALPAIIVPANEWFNYRFTFIVNGRVFNDSGYQVSAASGGFGDTLHVVGLSVTDQNGIAQAFNVASASGASYTSNGITPIPEPASMGLAAAGLLLLAAKLARRKN